LPWILAAAVLAWGCDEGTKTPLDTDTDADMGVDVDDEGCWFRPGPEAPLDESAVHGVYVDDEEAEHEFWIYQGVLAGDSIWPPATFVQIEMWPQRGGPDAAGTYTIVGGPYADCGLCILVRQGCLPGDGLAVCERDYLAVSGTLEVDELGIEGEILSGSLSGARLVETLVDWESDPYTSFVVEHGGVWCIEELDLESGISSYPSR
jgi:hypothetical protein